MAVTAKEADRLRTTIAALPESTRSVLEIGFQDGRMSAALRERVSRCVGLDLPHPIRDGITRDRVFGTIAALPFGDGSVDAIVCCEVLEHLDEPTFRHGLRELQRVAARHILVTVPFAQRLHNELSRCGRCGHVAHAYSHLRSFDEHTFRELMPGWRLLHAHPFGEPIKGYAPDWMYRVKFRLGGYPERPRICAGCGQFAPGRAAAAGKLAARIIWRVEGRRPVRRPWLLGLWEREV